MITLKHTESAWSKGHTGFDKTMAKIDEQWYRPMVRTRLAVFLKTLPDNVKAQYAEEIHNLEESLGVDQPLGGNENANPQLRSVLPEPIRYQPEENPQL